MIFCQIIHLCNVREDVKKEAHAIIGKFADRGLRSLAVAKQVSELLFFVHPYPLIASDNHSNES